MGTELAIVECQRCGKAWWSDMASGPIAGGPCCFGHPVLRVDAHPSEWVARKAWPAYAKARSAAISKAREVANHG